MAEWACKVCGGTIHGRVYVYIEVDYFTVRPGAPRWYLGSGYSRAHVGCWKAEQALDQEVSAGRGEV